MNASKKHVVSKSNKTVNPVEHFEVLESRQLMSVSLSHAVSPLPAPVSQELHVRAGHDNGLLPLSINIITRPITVPIHLPTLFVEPKVNSSVTGWKNFSSDPLFAPGGPSANDIVQGQVGDCWFLASLAEVAKVDPTTIENSISQRSDGTYDVKFHTSPTTTVDEHVDGDLPVNGWGGLEYAQLGQDNCTWVPIMEKAFTYFRNPHIAAAYSTIAGGGGAEAFQDLGGSATQVLPKVSNATQLFDDVIWAEIFNCAIDFGTSGTAAGPLVNDHEYSVVSARVSGGVDQIEVRNPWGYNPNFVANQNGYGATNNGYMWVSASSVLPELDEFVTASV